MANVTLKDLANPLKKIEKYTEKSEATLQVVEELVYSGQTVQNLILKELKTQTKLLRMQMAGSAIKGMKGKGKGKDKGIPTPSVTKGAKGDKKSLKEIGEGLKALGIGGITMAKAIIRFLFVPKKATNKFLRTVKEVFDVFTKKKYTNKGAVKKSAQAFKIIAESILLFAKNLAKATLLLPIANLGVDMFLKLVDKVMKKFATFQKVSKVEKSAEALLVVSDAILKFSKALALSALLLIPGLFAIPLLFISIKLVSQIFIRMGKKTAQIKKGGKALQEVGRGIRNFAIGLALFAVATMFIFMQPLILVAMVASLLLITGAVYLIGVMDKKKAITKGALTLKGMGLALALFGLGYGIFAWAVGSPDWMDIIKQAAILAGIGFIMILLGQQVAYVAQGIAMFAGIGLSMILFSIGYVPFAKALEPVGWNEVGIQMAVLTGVGLIMAGMGALVALSAGLILLGPLMYAAIGASLILLAKGLVAFQDVTWTVADSENLGILLGSLKAAFMGGKENDGFMDKIGGVFTTAVDAKIVINSAKGFDAIGKALVSLAAGLIAFKGIEWDASGKKVKVGEVELGEDTAALTTMLTSLSSAFATAGGEPVAPGGLFGKIFGNTFSPNKVERGIDSVMGAGAALIEISKGLDVFLKLIKKAGGKEAFLEGGAINDAVTFTLGFISTAFAAIAVGPEGKGKTVAGGGFFDSLFNVTRNTTEEGIRSVESAGAALEGIAKSLFSFVDLIKKAGGKEAFEVGGKLNDAVTLTLGFVGNAFAAIAIDDEGGGKQVAGGGFFDSLFNVTRNATEEGIRSVKGAGKELREIAESLFSFLDLIDKAGGIETFKEDGALNQAVTLTLGFVGAAFSKIGGEENEDTDGWFVFSWDENRVAKGIEAVSGAGAEMVAIAEGLIKFQELVKSDISFEKDGDLAQAVMGSVTFVANAFKAIGAGEQGSGWFVFSWDQDQIQKGITAVSGAGLELEGIATGLQSFQDLTLSEIDLTKDGKLMKGIGTTLSAVGGAFAAIGGQDEGDNWYNIFWDQDLIQKGIIAVEGAGDKLTEIAKGVESFQLLKNPQDTADAISKLFTATGQVFAEIGDKDFYKTGMWAVQSFWVSMAEVGSDNTLEKAAKDMGVMAKNISKLEINKMDGLAALMVTFAQTGEAMNQDAGWFSSISEGIGEMTEGFNNFFGPSEEQVADAEAGEGMPETEDKGMQAITTELKNLNRAVGRMNNVLRGLPEDISMIKLKVQPG